MHRLCSALMALIVSVLLALPAVAWADPGKGNGRDDPPAHGRSEEDQGSQEQDAEEPPEEEQPEEQEQAEPSEPSSDDASAGHPSARAQERRSEPTGAEPPATSSPADSRSPSAASAASSSDDVEVDFGASASSLLVGETSILSVSVRDVGGQGADDVDLLIDLPANLELVTATATPSSVGNVTSFDLGTLPPGGDLSLSATVVAIRGAPVDEQPVRFALSLDGQVIRHELSIQVADASPGEVSVAQSSPLLLQVGDAQGFSITVSNTAARPLSEVHVVAEVAPELDVLGVSPTERADAIQLGRSPSGEDIVWVFDMLAPGEEVQLSWTAQAVVPGDLEATNEVSVAVAGTQQAESEQSTYLAYVKGVRISDNDRSPVMRERQRTVTKLVPFTRKVLPAAAGILPVTGSAPLGVIIGGTVLVLLGLSCVWGSSRGPRASRLIAVGAVALLLTGGACVSDQTEAPDAAPQTEETAPATDDDDPTTETETDEKEKDQVLGIRLNRDAPEGTVPGDAPAEAVATPESVATTEVVLREVTTVESVLVAAPPLPEESMVSRAGDNTVSFTWDPASGISSATSGILLTAGAEDELTASVTSNGDGLGTTVTLRNLAEDRRLVVGGRLEVEITSSTGASSTLMSDRIQVVLEPGAATTADFTFALPAGTFGLQGIFRAD